MQEEFIRLSKPLIGLEEKEAVLSVLSNERLGMGNEVKKFENELNSFFGRTTICCINGTAALHLALQAMGIGDQDEVLVQSLTYVASFQAISACGAIPIACDIELESLTIDLKDAKRKLSPKTKAIMPVHFGGDPGRLDEIYSFAQENGLRVIEDAAHAFGSEYKNRKVGSFGDVSCFSFDGIKNITCGEGGCIVTNNREIMSLAREARLLGVENETKHRFSDKRNWQFDVKSQGWRYHMSDIMASIGRKQLEKLKYFAEKRKELAKHYDELFLNSKSINIFKRNYQSIVPHIYSIILPEGTDRSSMRKKLYQDSIETGIHYMPNHQLTLYRGLQIQELKNTDQIYPRLLSIPLHPDLNRKQVEFIANKIHEIIE